MTKKPLAAPRVAALQRVKAEPIDDPAEQAAIDDQRRRQNVLRTLRAVAGRPETLSALDLLRLCRRLPAEERVQLLLHLAEELSPLQQAELAEELVARMPPEAVP